MTLSTSCEHCGVKLKAKEEHIGRSLTCPKCQKPFVVKPPSVGVAQPRQAQPVAAKRADASSCPECGATLAASAVLCVGCGYHLKLGKKLHVSHETTDDSENRGYLDKLEDASPGTSDLMEKSGMQTDLSSLTIPGWCLVVLTVLLAGTAVFAPILMFTSSGNRTSGGVARAVGLPIALIVGGGTFWIGKWILAAFKIPITQSDD
jgi:hypothetical protein